MIAQWQENESQREIKRKEFKELQSEKRKEIISLKHSVEENKTRSEKIAAEKNILELQTSKGSANLMDPVIFSKIVDKISESRMLYEKSRGRAQNAQVDPTI